MKKQGFKIFLKPVSTYSNVAKETNTIEITTSFEGPSKSSRSKETEIANEKPNQPNSTFVFPKTTFAKQNRSCQAQQFVEYKRLAYNKLNDNVTFHLRKAPAKAYQEKNKEEHFHVSDFVVG